MLRPGCCIKVATPRLHSSHDTLLPRTNVGKPRQRARAFLPGSRIFRGQKLRRLFFTQTLVYHSRPLQRSHCCYLCWCCCCSDHDSPLFDCTCLISFVMYPQSCPGEVSNLVGTAFLAPAIPFTGDVPFPRFPRSDHSSHDPHTDVSSTWPLTGTGHVVQYTQQIPSFIAMLPVQDGVNLAVSSCVYAWQLLLLHLTHLACMDWRLIRSSLSLPCLPVPSTPSLWQASAPSHDPISGYHLLPSRRLNLTHFLDSITDPTRHICSCTWSAHPVLIPCSRLGQY